MLSLKKKIIILQHSYLNMRRHGIHEINCTNALIENNATEYLSLCTNNNYIKNWPRTKGLKFHLLMPYLR